MKLTTYALLSFTHMYIQIFDEEASSLEVSTYSAPKSFIQGDHVLREAR